jgi:hypothetical protein
VVVSSSLCACELLCLAYRRSPTPYNTRLFVVIARSRDRLTACRVSHILGSRRAMAAQEGWSGLTMVVGHCYFRVPCYGRTSFHAVVSWLSPSPLSCISDFKHCLQHRRCRAFFRLDASNSFPSCLVCHLSG